MLAIRKWLGRAIHLFPDVDRSPSHPENFRQFDNRLGVGGRLGTAGGPSLDQSPLSCGKGSARTDFSNQVLKIFVEDLLRSLFIKILLFHIRITS